MHPLLAFACISALLLRASTSSSLTGAGLVAGGISAVIHTVHPWPVFFALLAVFYLTGNAVTKVKKDVKARLTLSSGGGGEGGEGKRTHVQVLANTVVATVLIGLHTWKIWKGQGGGRCWPWGGDLEVVGIVW